MFPRILELLFPLPDILCSNATFDIFHERPLHLAGKLLFALLLVVAHMASSLPLRLSSWSLYIVLSLSTYVVADIAQNGSVAKAVSASRSFLVRRLTP